jgi:hypothetical protein
LRYFRIPLAKAMVPFDFSKATPITVPNRINRPMFCTIFPKPFWIKLRASNGAIPRRKAKKKAAVNKTRKGCSLVKEVPNTIHKITKKILKRENIIVKDLIF